MHSEADGQGSLENHSPWRLQDSPFCRISRCSHRISPTKSGASSRKHSLPRAQRAAPFMQNFWKSTPFRLNSFTAHITQSRTCVSVHCWGSAPKGVEKRSMNAQPRDVSPGKQDKSSATAWPLYDFIPQRLISHLCRLISPKEQGFYLFGTFNNSTSPLSLSSTLFFILLGFSPSSASCKASLLLPYRVELICKQKSWRWLQKEQLPKASGEEFSRTDRHNLSDNLQGVLKGFACKSRVFQLNLPRNKIIQPKETQKRWQMWRRASSQEDMVSSPWEAMSYLWGFPAAAALWRSR